MHPFCTRMLRNRDGAPARPTPGRPKPDAEGEFGGDLRGHQRTEIMSALIAWPQSLTRRAP